MTDVAQMDLDYSRRTLWFVLASLLLHFLLMLALNHDWRPAVPATSADTVDIDVVPMDKNAFEKLRNQIVETTLDRKTEKAVDNAYLGQQTQVVDRQTKAQITAPFKEARQGGAGGKTQAQPQPKVALGNLGVKMDFKPMGNQGPGSLSSTSDYLRDVPNGAQTLLNTKEYAYFSFYQRVRHQLEQYWEPGLRERLMAMFERGRRLASDQEHSTKLTVVMNEAGLIMRIIVDGSSGLMDLDQAAIDAFNKAGPFPNPPRGLVERDGTVKIEWEFILKT